MIFYRFIVFAVTNVYILFIIIRVLLFLRMLLRLVVALRLLLVAFLAAHALI